MKEWSIILTPDAVRSEGHQFTSGYNEKKIPMTDVLREQRKCCRNRKPHHTCRYTLMSGGANRSQRRNLRTEGFPRETLKTNINTGLYRKLKDCLNNTTYLPFFHHDFFEFITVKVWPYVSPCLSQNVSYFLYKTGPLNHCWLSGVQVMSSSLDIKWVQQPTESATFTRRKHSKYSNISC